jgi:acetyl-CoA C-acetyltransferase
VVSAGASGASGTIDPRSPCLIGVAQRTHRPADGDAPEPLDQWADVVGAAIADSGGHGLAAAVDRLDLVYCQSWSYDDPSARLAERLGLAPRQARYSGIGGTMPLQLLHDAGASILAGELDVAVVCGAEALATKRRMKKDGRRPEWRYREAERSPFPFEAPFHDAEVAHEVFQAWLTFALFDVARRAALGIEPDEYRRQLGELMAPMTRIAAANPHAWFPIERSASELVEPTADNRIVGYPYTKYTVAVMDVDMAAAYVVASHGAADRLGVPIDRRVYLRGWCYATDPVYVAEHPDLASSPAMRAASSEAMTRADVGIVDVAHLDLYSCFGSSLNFALDALGVRADDPRGVTVTGGLPFAGGPGSGYLLHAIATMVDVLRNDPGSVGLVSGVGMHMTKHAFGALSTSPSAVEPPDQASVQGSVDGVAPRAITDRIEGPATVAAYSVVHGRDGGPEWGLLVVDLPDGSRGYGRVDDVPMMQAMEAEEWVGRTVTLRADDQGVNRVVV